MAKKGDIVARPLCSRVEQNVAPTISVARSCNLAVSTDTKPWGRLVSPSQTRKTPQVTSAPLTAPILMNKAISSA